LTYYNPTLDMPTFIFDINDNIYISFFQSTLRLNSIKHAGPRVWNNLPRDLKVACSLSAFILKIKLLLIKDNSKFRNGSMNMLNTNFV